MVTEPVLDRKVEWSKAQVHILEHRGDWMALDITRSRPRRINAVERAVLGLPAPVSFESACRQLGANDGAGEQFSEQEIRTALESLARSGFLVSPDSAPREKPKEPEFEEITTLELNMAEDCNLRCSYCCVGQGGFGADSQMLISLDQIATDHQPRQRGRMTWETARQAIDLILAESGSAEKLHIRFFGGEPLLNQPVIIKSVEYAEMRAEQMGKRFSFSTVTNGTLLSKEFIDFMKAHDFWVQISIDGTQEMHDAFRLDMNMQGSYEEATALVPYLIETMGPDNLQVRGTLTHYEVDVIKAFESLRGLGFEDPEVRPVTGHDPSYAMTAADYRRYNDGLDILAERLLESRGDEALRYAAVFHPYMELLTTRLPRRPPCAAARNMIGVSVDGSIKPCTDMVGKDLEAIDLGSLLDGRVNRQRKHEFLQIVDVDNKPICSRCWARYLCGGACASVELSNEGGLEENAGLECIWIKHAVKLSIWLYVHMLEERPDLFFTLFGRSSGISLGPLEAIFGGSLGATNARRERVVA